MSDGSRLASLGDDTPPIPDAGSTERLPSIQQLGLDTLWAQPISHARPPESMPAHGPLYPMQWPPYTRPLATLDLRLQPPPLIPPRPPLPAMPSPPPPPPNRIRIDHVLPPEASSEETDVSTASSTTDAPRQRSSKKNRRLDKKTPYQKSRLEAVYARQKFPSTATIAQLAAEITLPVSKVRQWFQNKRAKQKRREKRKQQEALQRTTKDSGDGASPTT